MTKNGEGVPPHVSRLNIEGGYRTSSAVCPEHMEPGRVYVLFRVEDQMMAGLYRLMEKGNGNLTGDLYDKSGKISVRDFAVPMRELTTRSGRPNSWMAARILDDERLTRF